MLPNYVFKFHKLIIPFSASKDPEKTQTETDDWNTDWSGMASSKKKVSDRVKNTSDLEPLSTRLSKNLVLRSFYVVKNVSSKSSFKSYMITSISRSAGRRPP